MLNTNILLIFLGSLLTFLATLLVETFKKRKDQDNKEKNFKLIAKQEFTSVNKALDKLKTVFEYKNYFEYSIVDTLDKSIKNLESIQHDSIYLADEDVQEKFIDSVSELSSFATSIRAVQNVYYSQDTLIKNDKRNAVEIAQGTKQKESLFSDEKENEEAFQRKSTQKFIDLVEITRRLDDLIKAFEKEKTKRFLLF